jgi:hypothetical protein
MITGPDGRQDAEIHSNYDTFCLDECGNASNGVSDKSVCGVQVEPFTNLLQVYHRAAWQPSGLSPDPVVLMVREGELSYQDVQIKAVRGPQDGVYFVTWFCSSGHSERFTVGCAVHGFATQDGRWQSEYRGVAPQSVSFLAGLLDEWTSLGQVPGSLARYPLERGLRFNQGDLFLARMAGFQVASSLPGQAAEPIVYVRMRQQEQEKQHGVEQPGV